MAGGSIFVLVFVVWIHMGFFNPKPLDDITINLDLNESPKGDQQDEAHDYESKTKNVIIITNHLDEYIKGVIQLKDEKSIEYNIEADNVYKSQMIAADSLMIINASIIGNKPSVRGDLYSNREFTKRLKEKIFKSAENLDQLLKSADKDLVRPKFQNYMDNLNTKLNNYLDIIGVFNKSITELYLLKINKSFTEIYLLKKILTLLAEETINRSNQLTSLFKIIKQNDTQSNTGLLKYNAKEMKKLLERSYDILEGAMEKFRKLGEDVTSVKLHMKKIILLIHNMYDKRNAEKSAKLLFIKINEKSKYVQKELRLIQEWSIHIPVINLEAILKLQIEQLCRLIKKSKEYIDHYDVPGWLFHSGVDCYNGKGATDGQILENLDLAGCRDSCSEDSSCEAVVRRKADAVTSGRCWHKKDLIMKSCKSKSEYDIHLKYHSAGWDVLEDVNCYNGKGATDLLNTRDLLLMHECHALCSTYPSCEGVARRKDHQMIEAKCWLKTDVNLNNCRTNTDFADMYMKTQATDISSPPLDVDCSAAGTPEMPADELLEVECKSYNTNGRNINFYKIVRGQDPDYDCVVEVGR